MVGGYQQHGLSKTGRLIWTSIQLATIMLGYPCSKIIDARIAIESKGKVGTNTAILWLSTNLKVSHWWWFSIRYTENSQHELMLSYETCRQSRSHQVRWYNWYGSLAWKRCSCSKPRINHACKSYLFYWFAVKDHNTN